MKRLPLVVACNKDELITSWLSRNAALYDATSREMCKLIGSNPYKINRSLALSERETLASYFGNIETALSSQLEGQLARNGQVWIGHETPSATMGAPVEFCTKCFAEDRQANRTPYLRQQWFSAWSCRCHIHKTLLTPSCDLPDCQFKHRGHESLDMEPACDGCHEKSNHFSGFFRDPRLDLSFGQSVWGLPDQWMFEEKLNAALEGVAPGAGWISGENASSFVELSTRLVSYLCLRVKRLGMAGGHPVYHALTFPIAPRLGKQFPGTLELQSSAELLSQIPFHARLLVLQTLGIVLQKKHYVEWGYWTLVYNCSPIVWVFSSLPEAMRTEFLELIERYDEAISNLLRLATDHETQMLGYQQLSAR